jgi:hypothetical protein
MRLSIQSRLTVFVFALFSVMVAFAGPSTYTENSKKQTGKMVVAQFNYPGYATLAAQMAPTPGPDFRLQVGTVLNVTSVRAVKSKYAVPGNYNAATKTLFIPALIVKNQLGWTYYDVAMTANSGAVDAIGFPTNLIVTSMMETKVGEPSTGPAGPKGDQGDAGPQGVAGPAGADGAVGPQGPAGLDGADGATGPAGSNGTDGANSTTGC